MSYKHSSVGIFVFEETVRSAINDRITEFVKHIRANRKPFLCKMQSRKLWMEEFKQWSLQKDMESALLKYLSED